MEPVLHTEWPSCPRSWDVSEEKTSGAPMITDNKEYTDMETQRTWAVIISGVLLTFLHGATRRGRFVWTPQDNMGNTETGSVGPLQTWDGPGHQCTHCSPGHRGAAREYLL